MKQRTGFVSNSSSSSFIVRGIRIKEEELGKIVGVEASETGYYRFSKTFKDKESKLKIESADCYFDGEKTGEVILGLAMADADDGVVVEIKDDGAMDFELRNELKKIGVENSDSIKLSTFFQYVSNDNY